MSHVGTERQPGFQQEKYARNCRTIYPTSEYEEIGLESKS